MRRLGGCVRERLLDYRLGEGWGPLCEFLGKEVPVGLEFPRVNETVAFKEKTTIMIKLAGKRMLRKWAPFVVGVVAAWGIGLWYKEWFNSGWIPLKP
jgi:hypothetical protein